MIKFQRLKAVAYKESLHILRDWRSLLLALAIPMFLLLLFGYALNTDLNNVPTVVWDQSNTPESREVIGLFAGSPSFLIRGHLDNYRDMQQALDTGRAMVALVIPRNFSERIAADKPVSLQVLVDGSDSKRARLALGYATSIGQVFNRKVNARRVESRGMRELVTPAELDTRVWYNPDQRGPNVIIPGIIAIVMVVIAAMLTSVTVAREWEMGTMEQLISTPIRVPELVLGKVVPYFVIGMTDVAIAVIMGKWLFHVPLRGSVVLLFVLAAIFLTGALFFGLTLSIVLRIQMIANQISLVASYMPTLMLSGFSFAIANMPVPIQMLTYLVPGRYFITILRGIYLKGVGLEVLWSSVLFLVLFAVIMVTAAHKKMRLKLE
jgi:ABC-2 type transport system permease protein